MPEVSVGVGTDITRLKEGLEAVRAEVRGLKPHFKKEGEGLGKALFDGVKEQGSELGKHLSSLAGIAGLAGGVVAAFEATKHATDSVHRLQLLSEKLGETTQDIQRVQAVARASKTDFEALATSFLKLESSMGDPANKELAETFERLGVKASDLAGMTLPEKILALNEAFQKARASGTGVHDMKQILGRGFQELIPILSMSTEEVKKLMDAVNPMSEAFVTGMTAMDEAIETSENKIIKWGKIFIGTIATGIRIAVADFQDFYNFIGTAGSGGGFHWDPKNRRALMKEMEEDAEREANREDEIHKRHLESRKSLEESTRKRQEKSLNDESMKLDKFKFDDLADPEKLAALTKYLQEIYDQVGTINGEASEEGLVKWAEALKAEGDVDSLKAVIPILEKIKELKKQIEDITKKTEEHEKKNREELDKFDRDSRNREEKDLSPAEHIKAIKEDLKKIFSEEGVASLPELKEKARALIAADANSEEAKKAHADYNDARDKAKELAELNRPVYRASSIAQDIGILSGRNANDVVASKVDKTNGLLDEMNRGIQKLVDKDPPQPPPLTFDGDV